MRKEAATLWALFDDAYERANARAVEAGTPPCIVNIASAEERRYLLTDTRGQQRHIAVSLLLEVMEGHVRGGGFISTSRPYMSLFVAPVAGPGKVRWRVGTSGRLLTPDLVDDLFQSVVADDEGATRRLAPFITYSLG